MCQLGTAGAPRTTTEQALFQHALFSLDVIYAHRGAVSLLSTKLPDGINSRGYNDRGWTTFERRQGKPLLESARARLGLTWQLTWPHTIRAELARGLT